MKDTAHKIFRFDGFTLNQRCRTLHVGDRPIDLRPKSFDVLCCLVVQAGQLVTKDELMATVWPDVIVSDDSLTRCISDVRSALGDNDQHFIKTLPRRGYQFTAPVQRDTVNLALPVDAVAAVDSSGVMIAGDSAVAAATRSAPRSWRFSALLTGAIALLIVFASSAWWWHQPLTAPASATPSVAVLPLVNLSGDPDQAYFSDGLTEDLTVALSRFGHLVVIARSSAFQYAGKEGDVRQIGRALGARYLVQGSVRQDSQRLRITAQLVDADRNRQLWAEHHESEPDAVFAVQDELVQKIVISLAAHISKAEIEHRLRQPPETLAAYDYYLRGNALMRSLGRENRGTLLVKARTFYGQAVAADRRYALAVQALANTYLLAWLEPSSDHPVSREFQQTAILDRARSLAQQAVDLDASLAEAQATLGWILYWQGNII